MATPTPPFQQLVSQDFQNYQLALSPTALTDPTGTLFEAAFASMKDLLSDRIRLALKARLPGIAPPDALAQIALERGIFQGPTETDLAFANRLKAAWAAWPNAGTPFGVLSQLAAMGYPNVIIETCRGLQYMLNAAQTSVVVVTLPSGSWWIDSNRAPVAITAWAANTVYASGAAVMPSAVTWTPGTSFPAGTCVAPTSAAAQTGLYYRSSGGTSGATQPAWATQPGGTTSDNGITWTAFRRDIFSRTALGGTSGTVQPTWPTIFGSSAWNGFNWGGNPVDNTVTWSVAGFDNWSRFEVVFVPPLPSTWASGLPAYGSDEVTRIRKVIKDWSPTFARCNRIVVAAVPGASNWGVPNWGSFNYGANGTYGLQPAPWGTDNWGGFSYLNPVWGAGAGAPANWGGANWAAFQFNSPYAGSATWGSSTTTWQPI